MFFRSNFRIDGGGGQKTAEIASVVPAGGWASGLAAGVATEGGPRRKSFVTGAAGVDDRATGFDIRRRFEGDGERGGRRKSFEDKRPRPAFGASSIWATESVE